MDSERQRDPGAPDASDVVEGPVGSASIKDPASEPDIGADLEELDIPAEAGGRANGPASEPPAI
jgi:hypothetical protein